MDLKVIGKFLAQLRREHGYTQEKLGELLGVSNKTVSRWENGVYLPPVEMLQQMSSIYSVTINELLSGTHLTQKDYKEKAEENLKEAIRECAFSLGEKIAFYKRKWKKEHLLEMLLSVVAVIGLFTAGIVWEVPILQLLAGITAILLNLFFYNRMMAYVESHAYDGNRGNGG